MRGIRNGSGCERVRNRFDTHVSLLFVTYLEEDVQGDNLRRMGQRYSRRKGGVWYWRMSMAKILAGFTGSPL